MPKRKSWGKSPDRLFRARRGELLAGGGAGACRGDRVLIQIEPEVERHQDLVIIAPVLFQRVFFEPVFDEAETGIEPPRRFVFADDRELDYFDMRAGMIDDGFHEPLSDSGFSGIGPNVHPPQQALMSLLFAFADC